MITDSGYPVGLPATPREQRVTMALIGKLQTSGERASGFFHVGTRLIDCQGTGQAQSRAEWPRLAHELAEKRCARRSKRWVPSSTPMLSTSREEATRTNRVDPRRAECIRCPRGGDRVAPRRDHRRCQQAAARAVCIALNGAGERPRWCADLSPPGHKRRREQTGEIRQSWSGSSRRSSRNPKGYGDSVLARASDRHTRRRSASCQYHLGL